MDGQIRIYSEITDMDGDKSIDERSIVCEYHLDGESLEVEYTEKEEDVIHTEIKVDASGIKLIRKGFIDTVMFFAEGEMKACQYKTGYGEIDMWIETKQITKDFQDEILKLTLKYNLYMSGELFSKNLMEIVIFR